MRALMLLLLTVMGVSAQALDVTGVVGIDGWHSDDVRYLPSYRPEREFRAVSPFWAATVRQAARLGDELSLTFTAAGEHSAVNGSRLTRFDADVEFGAIGARVGLLPYRVSWCRRPGDGPWIQEPSAVCRYYVLSAMSTGAAGVQVYGTATPVGWVVDAMAGAYRPTIDGQSWRTFGPLLSSGLDHTRDERYGLSLNAVHLSSGVQVRGSVLTANEVVTGDYSIHTLTAYGAIQIPVTPTLDARLSATSIIGTTNYGLNVEALDTTAEVVWRPAQQHTLALGLSQYTHDNRGLVNTHRAVRSASIAWRWDVPTAQELAVIGQLTTSADNGIRGNAIGVRVQKSF